MGLKQLTHSKSGAKLEVEMDKVLAFTYVIAHKASMIISDQGTTLFVSESLEDIKVLYEENQQEKLNVTKGS